MLVDTPPAALVMRAAQGRGYAGTGGVRCGPTGSSARRGAPARRNISLSNFANRKPCERASKRLISLAPEKLIFSRDRSTGGQLRTSRTESDDRQATGAPRLVFRLCHAPVASPPPFSHERAVVLAGVATEQAGGARPVLPGQLSGVQGGKARARLLGRWRVLLRCAPVGGAASRELRKTFLSDGSHRNIILQSQSERVWLQESSCAEAHGSASGGVHDTHWWFNPLLLMDTSAHLGRRAAGWVEAGAASGLVLGRGGVGQLRLAWLVQYRG